MSVSRFPRHLFASIAILVAASTALGSDSQRREPQRRAARNRHVVVISLDGFSARALADPKLPLPTLRRLAARGAIASGMRPVNPVVTWPNHTTFVTGVAAARHGVLFNGVLVRDRDGIPPRVDPWRDKRLMVRVPTVYDLAYARGLTTAEVDWVAIQHPGTITWAFSERPDPQSVIARELVAAGEISADDLATFDRNSILWRDHIWTTAAVHILRRHRPHLLLFHLLNLDSTQHRYGPASPAAMTAMSLLDTQVARIVNAIDRSGLRARTTILVVSDHGFRQVTRHVQPNAALRAAGLLQVENDRIASCDAYALPEGGTAFVYLVAPDPGGSLLRRVRNAVEHLEGVDRVIDPAEYAALGLPSPEINDQMAAFVLTAKDGYSFVGGPNGAAAVDAAVGSLGQHGYVANDPEMTAIFIAAGRGIARGVTLDAVDNVDIAPTIASLLGIDLGPVDGTPLARILAAR